MTGRSYPEMLTHQQQQPRRLNGDGDLVTVPRAEYELLLLTARRHEALRQSLISGGVDEKVLALLSGDPQDSPDGSSGNDHEIPPLRSEKGSNSVSNPNGYEPSPGQAQAEETHIGHYSLSSPRQHHHSPWGSHHENSSTWADGALESPDESCSPTENHTSQCPHAPYTLGRRSFGANGAGTATGDRAQSHTPIERNDARTLFLSGLDPTTTHLDITKAVRGGPLVDVFLRAQDKIGCISFVQGSDAKSFLDYSQKYGLWIRNKRVDVKWADRQFILQPHVLSRIGSGATRNLIIRRVDSRTTEEVLRDELDHIAGLVVIDVKFVGSACHLQLNSVHNAMFARTCLMSRAKYKGSKIDWGVDECAGLLEKPEPPSARRHVSGSQPRPKATNRFQLLDIDGDDDDDTEEAALPGIGLVGVSA